MTDPMVPAVWELSSIRNETHDTFTFELRRAAPSADTPPSRPGQFNMLYLFGMGEVPISVSGDTSRAEAVVHTIRAVGTVTQAMARLEPGAQLGLRGPYGRAWPVDEARGRDVVLVAGGIGLAPLRPVMYHLIANRSDYGRIALLYGTRTPRDILFENELSEWSSRLDLQVMVTVDSAPLEWRGSVGVVTELLSHAAFDPRNAIAMTCGPEIMMRFTVDALQKRGMPDDQIFVSMERNMKCAVGFCGHCLYGPTFICKDGPVYCYPKISAIFEKREI